MAIVFSPHSEKIYEEELKILKEIEIDRQTNYLWNHFCCTMYQLEMKIYINFMTWFADIKDHLQGNICNRLNWCKARFCPKFCDSLVNFAKRKKCFSIIFESSKKNFSVRHFPPYGFEYESWNDKRATGCKEYRIFYSWFVQLNAGICSIFIQIIRSHRDRKNAEGTIMKVWHVYNVCCCYAFCAGKWKNRN